MLNFNLNITKEVWVAGRKMVFFDCGCWQTFAPVRKLTSDPNTWLALDPDCACNGDHRDAF